MKFNKEEIVALLNTYLRIQSWFNNVDVSIDIPFQDVYCKYNHLDCDDDVKQTYFNILERSKVETILFKDALKEIYDKHHILLPKEVARLIATRNPYFPRCDEYVLRDLDVKTPNDTYKDWVKTYDILLKKLEDGMKEPSTSYMINEFDKNFPEFKDLTPTKKIDVALYLIKDVTILELYQEMVMMVQKAKNE